MTDVTTTPARDRLSWPDLRKIGRTDNARRWYPSPDLAGYFSRIREPSRAWPWSFAKAAQTKRFAAWLRANRTELARELGL